MPELGPYGSVRGALSNGRPYRDCDQCPDGQRSHSSPRGFESGGLNQQ